jgi:group I intron endonuclease
LIAFLGYNYSPKWSKFNNYKFNNNRNCVFTLIPNGKERSHLLKLKLKKKFFNAKNKEDTIVKSRSDKVLLSGTRLKPFLFITSPLPLPKGPVGGNLEGGVFVFERGIRYNSTLTPFNNDNSKQLTDFLREENLKTVYCYEDLHLDSTRKKIKTDTKNLSGIYLILNKVTLDYYIGSAATDRFYSRFSNHLLYFHGSKILKLAVRKYKLSQFAFIILELFPEIVNKENNKKLLDLEDFYLKSLLPNYNILTEAGSSFGYKHTEISRLKMKNQYSLERRERIGSLNRGKSLSVETKDKIRISKKALTKEKPNYSEQAILNMKKNSKPIILYNLNKTVYGEFTSIVEAAKSIGCNEKTIRRALKTKKNFLKRRWIVKRNYYTSTNVLNNMPLLDKSNSICKNKKIT